MDPDNFSKLAFVYAGFPNAKLARSRVTPGTVVRPHGYIPESLQYNNAVFIRNDVAGALFDDLPRWPPKIPHLWPLQIPPLDELAMM
jgi:hypothetical protein